MLLILFCIVINNTRSPYNGTLQHLYNEGVEPTSIPALSTAFRTPNSVTSWYYGNQRECEILFLSISIHQ